MYPQDSPTAVIVEGWQGPYIWFAVNPYEAYDFRASLGIPLEHTLYCFDITHPLEWDDYTFFVCGTLADITPNAHDAPRFALRVQRRPEKDWEDLTLVAWLRIVTVPDTPVWVESNWHPTTGDTLAFKTRAKNPPRKDFDTAHKGRQLLAAIEAVGGRPPELDEAAFKRLYWDAYQRVLERQKRDGNALPKKWKVATEMLRSPRSLKRDRDKYTLPWPPLSPD